MTTALSKFSAALRTTGSYENNLTLASLNFDFSLYKVEAPVQYQGLGALLSNDRRTKAESGLQHITARKLGALFRGEMPKVPNLIEAYGSRASEIAKASIPLLPRKEGVFAEQMGIDGTSIWAAATSGPEALGMLLLACILARLWSEQEATSIWVEIVETRKQNLLKQEDHFDFPEVAAMQATLTREQLAEWDASARAWLRTADHVRPKQYTQLRLIVENVQINVSEKPSTYDSVMDAWILAMTTIDKLLAGIAQSVQSGSVLLALLAWHLYPDMLVYEEGLTEVEVKQGDSLFAHGGILTIGLEQKPNSDGGVRWSLPLSKLRYYGEPVTVTKKLDTRSNYISFEQLMFIALASLFKNWEVSIQDEEDFCEHISLRWHSFVKNRAFLGRFPGIDLSWLGYVAAACDTFLASTGADRKTIQRLMAFGRRHCGSFLSAKGTDNLIYGLQNPGVYLPCLADEDRIAHFQKVALDASKDDRGPWIIFYKESSDPGRCCFAPAAVESTHFRWVAPLDDAGYDDKAQLHERLSKALRLGSLMTDWVVKIQNYNGTHNVTTFENPVLDKQSKLLLSPKNGLSKLDDLDTVRSCIGPTTQSYSHRPNVDISSFEFQFFYGVPKSAALYRLQRFRLQTIPESLVRTKDSGWSSTHSKIPKAPENVLLNEIKEAFKKEQLNPRHFLSEYDWQDDADWRSLRALGAIGDLYKGLPHAKISMNTATKPLLEAKWVPAGQPPALWYLPFKLTRAEAISCIALIETGNIDLSPRELQRVMAMSINDSLYVAGELLCDPSESPAPDLINRVLGNVGKPGLSLLVPPAHPMVRKPKVEEWNLINHEDYDGKTENSFKSTSLHLSLTDYRVPYTTTHEGARDLQTYFQEAVLSIYDGSSWVADVNVLESLEKAGNALRRLSRGCPHFSNFNSDSSVRPGQSNPKPVKGKPLVVADNWFELLDRPETAIIVRSSGNWLGRLATAALSVQLGNSTFIVPMDACQKCFGDPEFFREWACGKNDVVIY